MPMDGNLDCGKSEFFYDMCVRVYAKPVCMYAICITYAIFSRSHHVPGTFALRIWRGDEKRAHWTAMNSSSSTHLRLYHAISHSFPPDVAQEREYRVVWRGIKLHSRVDLELPARLML